ncbi:IS4 family transposase [Mucilaginibacter gotjawali]|uniref:IS4 family transposase n=1 Tax=Mucilaginibacter gotjawali TaxID=1550579 RepID=UPI0021D0B529|nr:IS4 family transposase [Mucilaginibacter gotjawali]
MTAAFDAGKLSALARQSGFLQRKSKLKPEEFVDTLMFSGFNHNQLSLQECCNDLAQQHGKSLSKVALHKRFNSRSQDFLKSVLAAQIASKLNLDQANCWQSFGRVLIADSSKFSLPEQYMEDYPGFGGCRGGSALMNIQYAFDLKHGDWENLEFTKATQNDQSHSKKTLQHICKGDLLIRDQGYITQQYLSKVVQEHAFFLNRMPPKWKPVEINTNKVIDWAALYLQMERGKDSHFETMVTIGAGKDAFCCRLIAIVIPEQIWTERIRKAQKQAKSYGFALSDDYKERCRFSVFITNVGAEKLKAIDVVQLYRLRWQIELVFKTWKSLLGIHQVKAVKKERLECQLIARFIWILINWKIFQCIDSFIKSNSPGYACSIWKFFKQARQYSYALRKVLAGNMNLSDWCELFVYPIIKNLLVEHKKGKKPAYAIVHDIFNP